MTPPLLAVLAAAGLPGLAQAAAAAGYRPFLDPLPVWNVWYVLLIPLCAGVAVVWKSVKCDAVSAIPRQAAELLFWILLTMLLVAAGLAALVWTLEWLKS